MNPRSCETEVLISKHPDLAPVGSRVYMTPEEADLMLRIGRAERVKEDQKTKLPEYNHRAMNARGAKRK